MELDERKLIILKNIIDDYIMTASPVGSRTISKHSELGLSSATIRNEMSDLEEMGYLDQPHTSAGRIPSEKAYRLYVNGLMSRISLTEEEASKIRKHIIRRIGETEELIQRTAKVLSELTDYTSIVMTPTLGRIIVKHVQLVPVSSGKALAVIVTDSGIVRDAVIDIPESLGADELEKVSRMITQGVQGRTLAEAVGYLARMKTGNGMQYQVFLDRLTDAMEHEDIGKNIVLGGTVNLLKHPEYNDVQKARSMLAALEEKDMLHKMLSKPRAMELTITIGSENEMHELKDSSIVTATYKISGAPLGMIGIIGPTRMNYSRVAAVLGCMGESLSQVFSVMYDEDDDGKHR